MRTFLRATFLSVVVLLATAATARSQTLADLRAVLEQGGGWVPIEVRDGQARIETRPVPTGGIVLRGYVQIWEGNPGSWTLRASDLADPDEDAGPLLEVEAKAGQRVQFSQRTGLISQLALDVEWSEGGATTLWVWVGLGDDPPPPTRRGTGG